MTPEMIASIDAWIATQSGYVSRQDAIRRCVDLALGAEEQQSQQHPGRAESDGAPLVGKRAPPGL
ncbi:hypothetical protein VW29_09765 [Devosia limi DSM 17137]|uniref:CopG family transcriptional regulator n=1 Tax=Devosia limi DSM 17137 TaxID=1121477 RepID=A0A0F5LSP2_9HYPH|nr:hypothetical protein VW29_09765 [Devosia limi DSM 17137]